MKPLLEVRNLIKDYNSVRAVDRISFSIPVGSCFGLLGPNGAGKTTTIEIIEGIKTETSGQILYKGAPRNRDFQNQVGIQFQSTALMDYLNVQEILDLFSTFYKKSTATDILIEQCDLTELTQRKATQLSGGQRQRLLLALALVNDPEIIFLDEPTTGLDPQARHNFWELVNRIKKAGKTIVLTTHYMDEAQILCDELVIIDRGQIIDQGSPQQLLKKHFNDVCISLPKNQLEHLPGHVKDKAQIGEHQLNIYTSDIHNILRELNSQSDVDLTGLRIRRPTLEDLFIKLTGHQLRDD